MSRSQKKKVLRPELESILNEVIQDIDASTPEEKKDELLDQLVNEFAGLGPIEPLTDRQDITEIMVNGPKEVYVEKDDNLIRTDVEFRDNEHIMAVAKKIVGPLGQRLDEDHPYVDARLQDGSRVNISIPPLVPSGPTITIRKFEEIPFTISDLVEMGTLSEKMAEFFKFCVRGKLNILISGGTSSGKTTTLNCLTEFINNSERIITVEDTLELQLQQDHVIRCETRRANVEEKGEITDRDAVKNCLRMRPDRIIVGECRGAEAIDMMQAMNTGHEGSLTTVHANKPREAITRLETLCLMSGLDIPQIALREQIVEAIDLIIHQERMKDGTRKITSVTDMPSLEGDRVQLSDIFVFEKEGFKRGELIGEHKPTGVTPSFMEKFRRLDFDIPTNLFMK